MFVDTEVLNYAKNKKETKKPLFAPTINGAMTPPQET